MKHGRLVDTSRFRGFPPTSAIQGAFGAPKGWILPLHRWRGKWSAATAATSIGCFMPTGPLGSGSQPQDPESPKTCEDLPIHTSFIQAGSDLA